MPMCSLDSSCMASSTVLFYSHQVWRQVQCMAAAQVQQEYHMLFETPAADPDAVTRWRNRALRFVLPSDSNAPDVVSKPAAGDQSEGEDVRQWQKQAAACCATFSHNTHTATCCSCCLHCAMIFSHELSLLKRVTLLLPSLRCMQTFGSEHDSHAIDGDQRRPAASVL